MQSLVLLLMAACAVPQPPPGTHADTPMHPDLAEQSSLFERRVLEPVEGVHVAVGYSLANVVMLEGPDGVVIVDTTEGRTPATEALAALRRVSDKPIAAIIYTHNHADHVFGGQVFADAAPEGTPIWAQAQTEANIDRIINVVRDAVFVRSTRMFGTMLPADHVTGDAIGHPLRFESDDIALARPTHTFEDEVTIEAGGLTLRLIAAPGETDDQLMVWLPDTRVLLAGDNIYQAFPNLYTIRGTAHRDVAAWVDTLDVMRDLGADVLVPQHTLPVVGAAEVADVLTAYRDGIQYVHDQTIRGINHGKTPDQLAAEIRLPPHLASHPWLTEHYGRVPWSVRGIYAGTMGWFDGRSAGLEPLAPEERARRYAEAFGAGVSLADQARAALEAEDNAWAAELAQLWRDSEPDDPEAAEVLARALEGLAHGHINANARNWSLSEALEHRGSLSISPSDPSEVPVDLVDGLPLDVFMRALGPRLKAETVLDADWTVVFHFTDEPSWYVLHVRRGVAEVRQRTEEAAGAVTADLTITTTATTWKRVASGHVQGTGALLRGDLKTDGGVLELTKLQRWFER